MSQRLSGIFFYDEDHVDYVGRVVISSHQKFLIEKVEDEDVIYTDYFLTAP